MTMERRNLFFWVGKSLLAWRLLLTAALMIAATPAFAAIEIGVTVSRNGASRSTTITSPAFSTSTGNQLLLAFIATDREASSVRSVSGGGLSWDLVTRASERGSAEIWRAMAATPLTNASVTVTLSTQSVAMLTVMSFSGVDPAGAVGANASGTGESSLPSISLATTRPESLVIAVASDAGLSTPRVVGPGQALVNQHLSADSTYWVQRRALTTPAAGSTVTLNTTAPTTRRWQMAAVEIVAAVPSTVMHGISGAVSPAAIGAGATVSLSNGQSTAADSAGNYSFTGLANGAYTVTPSKAGVVFSPANLAITIADANLANVNFTANALTYNVSGTITPSNLGSGATVSLSNGQTTTADSAGNYSFTGLTSGTYTVTPAKSAVVFSPANLAITIADANVANVNFTANALTYNVSGTITPSNIGSGATVSLSNGQTATADSAGNYSFTGLTNGAYTVTPSKSGVVFSPANPAITIADANVTNVNFTANALTYNVSGTITPSNIGGGATVSLSNGQTTTADSAGNYSFTGLTNGTYTVTPSKSGFLFTPVNQSITIDSANIANVDFTITTSNDPRAVTGEWSAPFDVGIVAVNMVMLHTGKVMMFSGTSFNGDGFVERLWDPATGAITLIPNPFYNLFCSAATPLADGRILVAGGYDPASLGARNANIFDPITQTWSALPNMAFRRWYPGVTALPDGRALVTSGGQSCLTCLAELPEIFDPVTNRFTTLTTARLAMPFYPFPFVLPDGKIVNAGATENAFRTSTLDLTTNLWTTVDANVRDGHTAAMYLPGKIMKSGTAADSGTAGSALSTAFVLDMTTPVPAWRQVASMAFRRAFHNMTILPDGDVLVTGGTTGLDGYDGSLGVKQAELWSPATETWRTLAPAAIPRLYHSTALLLPDGRVLTAGSGMDGPGINQRRAEIFSPPYLFKGARPVIAVAPSQAQYGTAFRVETPDAARIATVSFVRAGAATHAIDYSQRFVPLTFSVATDSLSVQAPANANIAPPGYYMLFIVDDTGVPSVASWVWLPPPGADIEPPNAPGDLVADGTIGSASLTWTAATDNTGVALYNVHRSASSSVTPSAQNRIGQTTGTSYIDVNVTAGAHYYVITAQDVAGNLSAPSNEASALVLADVTVPTVTLNAPADGATVSGSVAVAATAADDVGVQSVQFTIDGAPLGVAVTAPPHATTWISGTTSNGVHTLGAVARDASGNTAEATITVTVSNTAQTPNGLVAAYGFNEPAGSAEVVDASGQGNEGIISGAIRTAAGRFGGALSFDGTSAWVTIADAPSLDLTDGLTISAWVNPTARTSWRTVALKEASPGLAYALYAADDALKPAGYINVFEDTAVTSPADLLLNVWTHLAFTYDGGVMRLYVNGTEVSTTNVAGATSVSNGPLRIGGNSVWGEYFRGLIDEVRIYNRALTSAEIGQDMVTPIP